VYAGNNGCAVRIRDVRLVATNVSVSAKVYGIVLDDWTSLCHPCLISAEFTALLVAAPNCWFCFVKRTSARACRNYSRADMTQVTTGVQLGEAEAVRASVSKYYGEVIWAC
jgi:hypothetical protein